MLAAGHVNGLGWDGGNARGRRATSWIAALLACALHVGIGSLIWRGMTPSPIPPAMPSDSESMFVELLAPPTPRAERSASPRGESGQVAAPARGSVETPAAKVPRAQPERAEPSRAQPSPTQTNTQKTCRQTRSQRQRDLASSPSLARASRLMCRPPARQRLRRAISVGSRRTRPRPANGARGEPVPRLAPRRRPNAPCCRARWRRPRVRLAAMRMRPRLLALPFLLADTVTDSGCSGDRRRRGRARMMRVADSHAGAICG